MLEGWLAFGAPVQHLRTIGPVVGRVLAGFQWRGVAKQDQLDAI